MGPLAGILSKVRVFLIAHMVVAAVAPSAAHAIGAINLSWSDCGVAGEYQRNFACDTNTGVNVLVASGVTEQYLVQVNGQVSAIYLSTNQPTLSPWWMLGSGGCRSGALALDLDFSGMSSCVDPWAGQASGSISYSTTSLPYDFNRARIVAYSTISKTITLNAIDEYYFFKVEILDSRSTGSGACGGCTDGACLVLGSIQVTQQTDPPPPNPTPYMDHVLQRSWVAWQPGGASMNCPYSTPSRRTTWGAVKSLYR